MSIYNALDEKEKIESKDLISVSETIPNNFISIINPLYPSSLKQASEPSFVLYFKGSISLLHNFHKIISFIGGDFDNKYNKNAVAKLIQELINEDRIILLSEETPMQLAALECIIQNNGKVIIVTGTPLHDFLTNSSFFKRNLEQVDYLIMSETDKSTMFNQNTFKDFKKTNWKIVSAVSKASVILETSSSEEIENFLSIAIENDKPIFAIPQPIAESNSISNSLLKQNAKLVETAHDILNKI